MSVRFMSVEEPAPIFAESGAEEDKFIQETDDKIKNMDVNTPVTIVKYNKSRNHEKYIEYVHKKAGGPSLGGGAKLVAVMGGIVVGYIGWVKLSDYIYLDKLATCVQNRGIGTRLVNEMILMLSPGIKVFVNPQSSRVPREKLLRFYSKVGFELINGKYVMTVSHSQSP